MFILFPSYRVLMLANVSDKAMKMLVLYLCIRLGLTATGYTSARVNSRGKNWRDSIYLIMLFILKL